MTSPQALFSVAGKNVLVTGGSRGLGLMIASTFVRHGANVLLTSRDPKACAEAAEAILTRHLSDDGEGGGGSSGNSNNGGGSVTRGQVYHVPSNVATREGCKELAAHTNKLFGGRLDVLVNNAGTSWGEDPGYDINSRESGKMNWGWDKVLDLNVKGMFYLTRECVPMLQRRKIPSKDEKGENDATKNIDANSPLQNYNLSEKVPEDPGRIINIGSVTGFLPQEAPTHAYDVSKAAVHHLTKKLAADLAPRGITVNAIAPGYVPSRMSKGLSTWGPSIEQVSSSIPMGRMGNEDDIGGSCVYLASKAAAWCTGTIVTVDGGAVGATQIPLSSL